MKHRKSALLMTVLVCWWLDHQAYGEPLNAPSVPREPSRPDRTLVIIEAGNMREKIVTSADSDKHGLAVKAEDEPGTLTWDAAVDAVRNLRNGWRLPTIAELRTMYDQRTAIGGFAREDYWSSTEQDVNSAWIQGFRSGDQDRYNKQSKLKVRAVRTF